MLRLRTGPQRLGALLLALLVAGCLSAFGLTVFRLYTKELEAGLATAQTHARSFEQHLTQTLQVIDLMMVNLNAGAAGKPNPVVVGDLARTALRPAPFLRSISVLDADGRVLASSSERNLDRRIDHGDVFPLGDMDAEVLRIGVPRRGRDVADIEPSAPVQRLAPTDLNAVPVLRRLPGTPVRWALAIINPDYFIDHFAQLLDPLEGRVQLLRHDGVLLASSSPTDMPGARGLAGVVPRELEHRESGRFEQTLLDGTAVLSAYRASSRFPVLIAVHIDRERVLASWRTEVQRAAALFLPALAALSIAVGLALRRQGVIAAREAELQGQMQLAASVFDASSEAIALATPAGDIRSCNPAFLRMTGYDRAEVLGRNYWAVSAGLPIPDSLRETWEAVVRDGRWEGELVNRRKDGSLYDVLVSINAVRNGDGELQHYVGVARDITELKRAQSAERDAEVKLRLEAVEKQLLQDQAVRDSLTGLFNRRFFDETLPREIARAQRSDAPLAVIMVDIDHFKQVNDTHGHRAGDEVIRTVGRILRRDTRADDVICRYGGEEFLIAMPGMELEGAKARAEKWCREAAAQHTLDGTAEIRITLSAGVAAFPLHGADADALVRSADLALYTSKRQGRNRVTVCRLPDG
jgi:diguanylate cyclase (GGDEF)-like protein/PAS domain S-box-containing protein